MTDTKTIEICVDQSSLGDVDLDIYRQAVKEVLAENWAGVAYTLEVGETMSSSQVINGSGDDEEALFQDLNRAFTRACKRS